MEAREGEEKTGENRGKQRSLEEEREISGGHESWNRGKGKWRVMVAKMIRETNIKMINMSRVKFEKRRCNEADEEEKFLMLVQQVWIDLQIE